MLNCSRVLADSFSSLSLAISKSLEPVTGQLNNTIAVKLTAVEVTLKDSVTKLVKSKVVAGTLQHLFSFFWNLWLITFESFFTQIICFYIQNTTDAIGRAAAEAMQGPIQAAYKDAFQSIVLPVFERGCQSMFQQINDSFKQGTQECKAT